MIGAARIDRYVINRHEWFAGGHQLGPRGRMHVLDLAQDLSVGGGSVIIESEPVQLAPQEALDDAIARTEDLNELRRMTVIDMLVTNGVPDAEGRVIVSGIDRVGPRGIESPRIYNQLLRGGQQGGGGGMGGGGMGGGMGGGGMGGGMGGGGFF